MDAVTEVLSYDEKITMKLRSLYRRYGYRQFKMSKFEEYDLYASNKDFLVSSRVITFTDANGRLMALKPDVTLSIVNHFRDEPGMTEKLCYNENIYRAGGGADEFKEIMQTGLECIGQVDLWSESEVLLLAVRSLELIGDRYVLDLSHMGLLPGLLEGVAEDTAARIIKCARAKRYSEIKQLCKDLTGPAASIPKLISSYLPIGEAIAQLEMIGLSGAAADAVSELRGIYEVLTGLDACDNVNLDLSIVGNLDYYNGVVFQGFVDGAPSAVLSGGRYDGLVQRFGKNASAIGFAVYMDALERMGGERQGNDVDDLVLYGEDCGPAALAKAVKELTDKGRTVRVSREIPAQLRFGRLCRMKDGGLEVETDA